MREAARRAAKVACAIATASALGGCSFALPSILSDGDVATGSLAPKPISPLSPELSQEDWRRARAALGVALDPQGNGSSVSWDNPESGLKGAFTPVAQPFVKENEICRAFVATLVLPERTSTLQGTGCRRSADEWDVKDVRPFRKPA